MSLKTRVSHYRRRMLGRSLVGAFDGIVGLAFEGWVECATPGTAVTLKFGDEPICQTFAEINRPDLALVDIKGYGFSVPLSAVEAELKRCMDSGLTESAPLRAFNARGEALAGSTPAIQLNELLLVMALSTAIRALSAPTQGLTHVNK